MIAVKLCWLQLTMLSDSWSFVDIVCKLGPVVCTAYQNDSDQTLAVSLTYRKNQMLQHWLLQTAQAAMLPIYSSGWVGWQTRGAESARYQIQGNRLYTMMMMIGVDTHKHSDGYWLPEGRAIVEFEIECIESMTWWLYKGALVWLILNVGAVTLLYMC